jgi:hypothetical protein
MAIAKLEGRDLEETERNFGRFGGIIRYTLGDSRVIHDAMNELDKRCNSTSIEVFRSIAADIDDSANAAQQYTISGFLVCYSDIPREGEDAFATWSLAMTSEYASTKIQELFDLEEPLARLDALARHLDRKSRDFRGTDLESSVVHMLASGPQTLKWYYCSVDAGDVPPHELRHTKRKIERMSGVDNALLNYPTERTFGLVDCFMFIEGAWCAFQITWQEDHPFKLRTLMAFRRKLGVGIEDTVNIYFVSPTHRNAYMRRSKLDYLVNGESLQAPIVEKNGTVLLQAAQVLQMWENTHIHVAFPENDNWKTAIKKCSASLQSAKEPWNRKRARKG